MKKRFFWNRFGICVLLCLISAFLFSTSATAEKNGMAEIVLRANDIEILQDEEVPALQVTTETVGNSQLILDEEKGYTVNDLVNDFNEGKNYTVTCDADNKKESKTKIKLALSEEIQKKVVTDWLGKVDVVTEDGTFTVRNKYGDWEGDKFKKYDGSYAENDFITSKGKTYYFNEEQKKVTGWQNIGTDKYYFDKNGVMQNNGWKKEKDATYYLQEDGTILTGWLAYEDEKYYFDADGKMVTGKQQIGSKKCEFAKDGKLESMEDSLDPNKPMVALTFDDGPGKRTEELLDVLEQNGAHATFFMVGPNVKRYPETVKRIYETGNELGNHSTNHPQLTKLSPEKIQKEMNETNEAVKKASGVKPTVMRPPYGAINDKVKANVGLPMIMWSIDTLDWKTKNVEAIKNVTYKNVKDGDVILLHDIHNKSVDAAKEMIPELIAKGYQLVTISEMAEARGVTLEKGGRYAEFKK